MNLSDERARVRQLIENKNVESVRLGISEIAGDASWMSVSASSFLDILEGGASSSSAVQLDPDLSTFTSISWNTGVATCFCNLKGSPETASTPRQGLANLQQRAEAQGYSPVASATCHLQVFQERSADPAPPGKEGIPPLLGSSITLHAIHLTMTDEELLSGISRLLREQGIDIEESHRSQLGQPGSYTLRLARNSPLQIADQITFLREACREILRALGLAGAFQAATSGVAPCFGISLWDRAREANLFWDQEARAHLSLLARRFLTGVLDTLPEFIMLFAPGRFFPADNAGQTCAVRVHHRDQRATRLETPLPDPFANPHLALAATLAAGLYGIEKKHTVPLAWEQDVYHQFLFADTPSCIPLPPLPRNPWTALDGLEQSQAAQEYLGTELLKRIISTRLHELHTLSPPEFP